MATPTIIFGVLFVLLGFGGYVASDGVSMTALIPVLFGIPLIVLGAVAQRPSMRKAAMHGAVVIGLLGFLGSVRGLPKFIALVSGTTLPHPLAAITQSIMATMCAIFIALCVHSFIQARRAR